MIIQPKPQLGRLARVDLRQAWISEATDFTPWLAQPDNIRLLGDAIGIELEVESQEKNVGPFRADILCRDTVNGRYVLVENQLERTDHGHLGQLLTYAAGLDAVTVVWVAARFTEEHRAALDWLNRATSPEFNFFGLEIEVWRIGDSAMAPKFNVVSKPNDWSKTVKELAALVHAGQLTESQQRHLAFWTQFRRYLEDSGSPIVTGKPRPSHWTNVSIGRSDFTLNVFNNFREGRSGVQLWLDGPHAKAHYHLIEQRHRAEVEARLARLGGEVNWREMPAGNDSAVMVQRRMPQTDPATWPEVNAWMASALRTMSELFRPIVRDLDASGWVPAASIRPTGPEESLSDLGGGPAPQEFREIAG